MTTQKSHAGFVAAMCKELELRGAVYGGLEPVETIYFGGGTPSRLSVSDLESLIKSMNAAFDTSKVVETTLEINPEDATPEYLGDLRSLGIDRLSIGIQSFFDTDLKLMNRAHDADLAKKAVLQARESGFNNFSIDLIFGLPEQPPEYWSANLEIALALEVPHVSTYGLTVESATPLHNQVQRGLIQLVSDEEAARLFSFTIEYLTRQGFEHYEISSFAQSGFRSVHNHRYWDHSNYIGFGPSAHSFWWSGLPAERWSNVRSVKKYEALLMQHVVPIHDKELLGLDTLADEYILLRLRTTDGLDLQELEERYGVDLLMDRVAELADLESGGLIRPIRNHIVTLTDLGKNLCDSVTARLLPD